MSAPMALYAKLFRINEQDDNVCTYESGYWFKDAYAKTSTKYWKEGEHFLVIQIDYETSFFFGVKDGGIVIRTPMELVFP